MRADCWMCQILRRFVAAMSVGAVAIAGAAVVPSSEAVLERYVASRPQCRGHVATIVGTDGADRIVGTDGRDVIVAGRGNDAITSRAWGDLICAGGGADLIDDGRGRDHVLAQRGDDAVVQARGDDRLNGGPNVAVDPRRHAEGDVLVYGETARYPLTLDVREHSADLGPEHDVVAAFEHFEGTGFADEFVGGPGSEVFASGDGRDLIEAGRGRDVVNAGSGADRVQGGLGRDRVWLEGGRDRFVDPHGGSIVHDGARRSPAATGFIATGAGRDRLWLSCGRYTFSTAGGEDRITVVGNVRAADIDGGSGNDSMTIRGDEPERRNLAIALGKGSDVLAARFYDWGAGTHVSGGRGNDVIDASRINVPVVVRLAANGILTTVGTVLVSSFEDVVGGRQGDVITGNNRANVISGGRGADRLSGLGGDDQLDGGEGDDTADGGSGIDSCLSIEFPTACESQQPRG